MWWRIRTLLALWLLLAAFKLTPTEIGKPVFQKYLELFEAFKEQWKWAKKGS